jgi:hypothetical protein
MSTTKPPVKSPANVPVTRERNWAVWVLVALAVVAGILAFVDAARYMGWIAFNIPIMGQEISFVLPSASWFAAIMSALVGVIYFVVAGWLYNLNPSGWLFVVVIAIINIIFLFLAILGQSTFSSVLLQLIVNAALLLLAFLPGTQAAFGRRGGSF